MYDVKQPFLIETGRFEDSRGAIGILDHQQVPFKVMRTFWIYQVPENTLRGGHAHKTSEQLLICTDGAIEVQLEELSGITHRYSLSPNQHGLYLPCMCWGKFIFRNRARALCMASDSFDESDYIRDYKAFEKLRDEYDHS